MLISFEIEADGYRPTTWANWVVLATGASWNFTPTLEVGNEPKIIDYCAGLLATPQVELSAALGRQAALCAQLPAGRLPGVGGGSIADRGRPVLPALIAIIGAALICVGAFGRHVDRTN
jgi:hypothetical protein